MNEEHVDRAVEALKAHAFVGLLEAYNASVLLLAAAKFERTNLRKMTLRSRGRRRPPGGLFSVSGFESGC